MEQSALIAVERFYRGVPRLEQRFKKFKEFAVSCVKEAFEKSRGKPKRSPNVRKHRVYGDLKGTPKTRLKFRKKTNLSIPRTDRGSLEYMFKDVGIQLDFDINIKNETYSLSLTHRYYYDHPGGGGNGYSLYDYYEYANEKWRGDLADYY